jgi:hypothetical protein
MKNRSHTREGGWKKEVKKMNMLDVLSIEFRIFKPVEITVRRGLK